MYVCKCVQQHRSLAPSVTGGTTCARNSQFLHGVPGRKRADQLVQSIVPQLPTEGCTTQVLIRQAAQGVTQGVTQGVPQGVTQGVTRGGDTGVTILHHTDLPT